MFALCLPVFFTPRYAYNTQKKSAGKKLKAQWPFHNGLKDKKRLQNLLQLILDSLKLGGASLTFNDLKKCYTILEFLKRLHFTISSPKHINICDEAEKVWSKHPVLRPFGAYAWKFILTGSSRLIFAFLAHLPGGLLKILILLQERSSEYPSLLQYQTARLVNQLIQQSMSERSGPAKNRNFKIVLLGDSGVGKTALIERFTHNRFETKQNPTIGIDFVGKNVTHNAQTFRLQLWDTAGQERYRSLIPSYLKDAICAVFVFDITSNQSLSHMESWIQLFKDNRTEKAITVLCANKLDLIEKQEYSQQTLKFLSQKYKMKVYEASALSGEGVSQLFHGIVQIVCSNQQKKKKRYNNVHEQMEYFASSQNLYNIDMKSDRSTSENKQGHPEKAENSFKSQQQHNTSKHTESLPKLEADVPRRRCC